MLKEKSCISNRFGEKVVIETWISEFSKGLIFLMHGLGGYKEQEQIQYFAKVYSDLGMTVVTFDTTNSIGESGGLYEDATITNYYSDLEDVIDWSKDQKWYSEPFVLSGPSLGGICSCMYAERYPEKVKALVPFAPVINGELRIEAMKRANLQQYLDWEKTGWKIAESRSRPGLIKKLKFNHVIDNQKYDILKEVDKIKVPVLLIVGEKDKTVPTDHVEILYNALNCPKEFHIINGSEHTFKTPEHLEEIRGIIINWFAKNNIN